MYEDKIRKIAWDLLEKGNVDFIIGWEKGSLPFLTAPLICRDVAETERLVWNPFCANNLARYLKYYKGGKEKIALCVKGCDARAVSVLLREEQIERERLVLIGLPCHGLINPKKLLENFPDITPGEVEWEEGILRIRGKEENIVHLLEGSCTRCRYPDPPIHDFLVGEKLGEGYAESSEVEDMLEYYDKMSTEEREEFFAREMERCIRCYACRNACPLCYCQECFAESTRPSWVSPAPLAFDNLLFQLGRTMHMAGRCVECGACGRSCPVEIPIDILPEKVAESIRKEFGFESGLDTGETAPLLTYREDDQEDFIK